MDFWILLPMLLGILGAFVIAAYVMACRSCPYDRVAVLLTVLASDVFITILAYALFNQFIFLYIATFALTKCVTWLILMDLRGIVHFNNEE